MNKKFLSAILFGALMVTSTGTFVSCKDYDDDIDAINKELTDVKSQIAALQAKVDAGKWITSANSTAEGVTITLSDGSTLKITNGKDGAQGAAGQNGADGKNGTVVTVNENGVLCLDGVETAIKVAEEAPAALPCVKVEAGELMVLQADGTYAASGIKAGSVTAAKVNGMWTITVDGETITVPGSAALTSIEIHDEDGNKDFSYYYGVLNEAKAWGWDEEESMEAGFYTKLDRDMIVLLNPAEADGTAFDYTFRNSLGAAADVKFFEDAKPYEGALYSYSRAASNNGLWVLPAAVTKKPASEIETLRRELYLNFKGNDASAYALTLEAVDGMGNVAVRSDYDYTIALEKAGNYQGLNREYYNLIGKAYYPTLYGAVYDYKIRVNKSAANLRWAKVFGVELTADEKGYIAKNESAVFNGIKFDVTGILINGETFTDSFTVYFTNEMTTGNAMQVDALKDALDATWNKNGYFEYTYKYDLSDYVAELSDDAKLLWDQQIADGSYKSKWYSNAELIGGEVVENGKDYNEDNINWALINNISWSISGRTAKEPNILTYTFRVNNDYYRNFQLNTAYQLSFDIIDPLNETVKVATITLPFEFTQPTLDITRVNGEKAIWTADKDGNETLSLYGDLVVEDETKYMYAPLYEAFDNYYYYDSKGIFQWEANTQYYTLNHESNRLCAFGHAHYTVLGVDYENQLNYVPLTKLTISSKATQWGASALAPNVGAGIPVEADYTFYGVYPATEEQVKDFTLRFASLLGDAKKVETVEASYTANNVTREVILTDENFNLVDALGNNFFLFDGVKADGNIEARTDMNLRQGFEEGSEGFATDWTLITDEPVAYYLKNGVKQYLEVDLNKSGSAILKENTNTKTRYWEAGAADANNVLVTMLPAMEAKKDAGYVALAGGVQIQLPTSVGTTEPVTIEFTLEDVFGVEKTLSVVVKASK